MTLNEHKLATTEGPELEAQIRARQVQIYHDHAQRGLLPLALSTICYAALFDHFADRATVLLWSVAVLLLIVLRGLLSFCFWRAASRTERRWVYLPMLTLIAIGGAYGITPLWIPIQDDSWLLAVTNLWLGGLVVAVCMGQGLIRNSGLAFAIPALVPLVSLLVFSADPVETLIGIGNILFFSYMFSVIRHTQTYTLNEARDRVRYAAMAARLELQQTRSEQLVAGLTAEIARRKKVEVALKRARIAAETRSNEDHLTGLASRRVFDKVLSREWARALREQQPLSLILCDIDRFRGYNERYGHHAGDQCLARLASVVGSYSRRAGDLVARFGGEEFAVLLPATGEDAAIEIAEAIRSAVYDTTLLHGASEVEPVVTASCGVATIIPASLQREKALVEAAAHALQRAKRGGRNCVFTIYGALAIDEGEA